MFKSLQFKIMKPSRIKISMLPETERQESLSKSKFGTGWAVFRDPANGKYLLCERSPTSNNAGQWGFPGGGVDEGESHVAATRRECSEEIKVDLPASAFKPVIGEDETNTTWYEVFQKVSPKRTEEVSNYRWVFAYELDELPLHKSVRNYFRALRRHVK